MDSEGDKLFICRDLWIFKYLSDYIHLACKQSCCANVILQCL